MMLLLALVMQYQVNLYRANIGLSKVETSKETCELADIRLSQIKYDFSHDELYRRFSKVKDAHYENLGIGFATGTQISNLAWTLKAWKNSPTHNKNLLRNMDSMCFRTDGIYWVMEGFKKYKSKV